MPLTTAAATLLAGATTSGTIATPFNNANSYIGVGDSTAVFSAAHTDLQGTTNRTRVGMDATYPTTSGLVLTYRSTFATGQANYAWQEWGVFNHSTTGSGTMLNRKVESLGTKTSAQTWQFTVTLTYSA